MEHMKARNYVMPVTPIDTNPDAIKAAVEKFKRMMPETIQMITLLAQLRKVKFDALVKEGFTEPQALQIVVETEIDM